MSCLCPISIPDKVLSTFGIRDHSILVPCGHCVGCAKDRRNDWFVRLWSVYQSYRRDRLPVWFVTVTIDPNLWPNMNLSAPDVRGRISPFVRSWTERFRYLHGGKMPLRFLCSEFGSQGVEYVDHNGVPRVTTGALHFHGLIFGRLDVRTLQRGLAATHGHVDFDLVRGPEAIRYVVKYCTKDYSIEDPLLRARTFCSPGIGDSRFYFNDSLPTPTVLINGFHYRTPRYFIDKQFIHVYGKSSFVDPFGRTRIVRSNALSRLRRFVEFRRQAISYWNSDDSLKSYIRFCASRDAVQLKSAEQLNSMLSLRLVGSGHPFLRHLDLTFSNVNWVNALSNDRSFLNFNPILYKPFNNYFYERHNFIIPLPLDFSS